MGTEKTSYLMLAEMFYQLFSESSQRNNFYRKVLEKTSSVNNGSFSSTVQSLKNAFLRCTDLPKEGCLLLLGIDEVHLFFEQRKVDVRSNHTIFSRLKSVFSEVIAEPLCIVVLSTAGAVSQFSPSPEVARERDDDFILQVLTPFTELPLDIDIISDPLVPGRETLSSVGFLKFAARFGRPMYVRFSFFFLSHNCPRFFAYYKSRSSQGINDGKIADTLLTIIQEKLYGFTWPPDKPATDNASSFAVLSARLLLDLSPTASHVRKYEENQVRSHLRMLYSVKRERGVIVTGSSPEPLIAEASATFMNLSLYGSAFMDVWALLSDFIKDGLIAQGTASVGDLIGRVLSIRAMDDAIETRKAAQQSELKYQTPVTVAEYYKALLNDTDWNILRKSVPANVRKLTKKDSDKTFEEAFAGAYVHFSHYAKANDDTPLKDEYSWALWLRGTAILCQLNQNLTDRAIPIFFAGKKGEKTVGPKTMSLLLDQDKMGQLVNPSFISNQSAISLHENGLPYIDAVHCYALTKTEIHVGTPPRNPQRDHPLLNQEAPRYRIEISGLESYKQIPEHHIDTIRAMIDGTKNALFNHHPSQSRLPLLRQQQPMLNGSPATTAWFGGLTGHPGPSSAG